MAYNRFMKRTRIVWLLLAVLLLTIGGFVLWGSTPAQPMPEALMALRSDEQVLVSDSPWLIFTPRAKQPDTGVIFYPGGRVDYRAYAPLARRLAEQGYLVVIPPMPLNLAVLAPEKAMEILQEFPNIQRWVIGGHSLGGAMAAHFVKKHPDNIQGLIFLASYPAEADNLQELSSLKVLSIYASQDGLATPEKVLASRTLLPADTDWVEIVGGNHAQFGWYGNQNGDRPAEISREQQTEQIVSAILDFLNSLVHP